jgi:hypothetical protein
MTRHLPELSEDTDATAAFGRAEPGSYSVRLISKGSGGVAQQHEVEVWVTKDSAADLEVKGVIFADLWGQFGGPEFDVPHEDSVCLAKALDHALVGPLRDGAGWVVGFVPASFITLDSRRVHGAVGVV